MKKKFNTPESVKTAVQEWASSYSKTIVSWKQIPRFLVATFHELDLLSTSTLRELADTLDTNIVISIEDGALQLAFRFDKK